MKGELPQIDCFLLPTYSHSTDYLLLWPRAEKLDGEGALGRQRRERVAPVHHAAATLAHPQRLNIYR